MAYTKKLEDSKKDMNFFSEFGGSSGQVGSYLSLILIVFVGFILIAGSIYGLFWLQAYGVRNQINALSEKMNSKEYIDKLNEHQSISYELSGLTEEYFDISMLYSNIDSQSQVNSAYLDFAQKYLPKDMIMTNIVYDGARLTLSGTSESYYSPLDYLAKLSEEQLFSRAEIDQIDQIVSDLNLTDEEYLNEPKYHYSLTCYIKEDFSVRLYRLQDDVTSKSLAPIEIAIHKINDRFDVSALKEYTSMDGVAYTLSRIVINDVQVTTEQFDNIILNDSLSVLINSETNIKLYYLPKSGVVKSET